MSAHPLMDRYMVLAPAIAATAFEGVAVASGLVAASLGYVPGSGWAYVAFYAGLIGIGLLVLAAITAGSIQMRLSEKRALFAAVFSLAVAIGLGLLVVLPRIMPESSP